MTLRQKIEGLLNTPNKKLIKDDRLLKILIECYIKSYKQAEPSIDFMSLLDIQPFPFENYYLSEENQNMIVKNILSKYKLTKIDKKRITTSYYLGLAPTFTKQNER